jgi:hypothetical protein
MKKMAIASARQNPNSVYGPDGSKASPSGILANLSGIFNNTKRSMRASPLMWTAILAVAGGACFAAKSAHLGTVVIGSIGVLWMWQDMIDEAAATKARILEKGA